MWVCVYALRLMEDTQPICTWICMSGWHEAYHQAIGTTPTTQCVPWSRIHGRHEAYNPTASVAYDKTNEGAMPMLARYSLGHVATCSAMLGWHRCLFQKEAWQNQRATTAWISWRLVFNVTVSFYKKNSGSEWDGGMCSGLFTWAAHDHVCATRFNNEKPTHSE